jgi:hypothetical protein
MAQNCLAVRDGFGIKLPNLPSALAIHESRLWRISNSVEISVAILQRFEAIAAPNFQIFMQAGKRIPKLAGGSNSGLNCDFEICAYNLFGIGQTKSIFERRAGLEWAQPLWSVFESWLMASKSALFGARRPRP